MYALCLQTGYHARLNVNKYLDGCNVRELSYYESSLYFTKNDWHFFVVLLKIWKKAGNFIPLNIRTHIIGLKSVLRVCFFHRELNSIPGIATWTVGVLVESTWSLVLFLLFKCHKNSIYLETILQLLFSLFLAEDICSTDSHHFYGRFNCTRIV